MRSRVAAILFLTLGGLLSAAPEPRSPQAAAKSRAEIERESRYYALETFPIPEGLKLEASGLASLPDGRLAIAIRKGEVWILDKPTQDKPTLQNTAFTRFASGLHEPLGLAWHDGALYTTQRSEVTRLRDTNGDGAADEYLTAAKGWGVSGNYHEYAYGPVFDRKGDMWVTLNCTIGKAPVGDGFEEVKSFPWRGWSLRRSAGGPLLPISAGLRSPSGLGTNHLGDVFATDQQGNWWGTNPLLHLKPGIFHGHADSLIDCERPESPVVHPGKLPSGLTTAQAIDQVPGYAPPAVWFPYNKVGASPCGFSCNMTGGKFGPFENQLFVGEFTYAFVARVFLEKIDGEYQGACFRFRSGMKSGVFRTHFLDDGSLILGETNRGWNSIGTRSYALERLRWTGKMPFEMKTIEAKPDGFLVTFTKPVDPKTAADPDSWSLSSYTYKYQKAYGSPEMDPKPVQITQVTTSRDHLSVHLACTDLRRGYVHELHADGVRAAEGEPLLHADGYYTLNRVPKK
ncbi:MAG: hypothetical protein ACKJSK_18625 [Roseibacillus sp.]